MMIQGLMADTPLGQLVTLRAEKEPQKLTPEQRKIWNEWHFKNSPQVTQPDYDMLKNLFGGLSK